MWPCARARCAAANALAGHEPTERGSEFRKLWCQQRGSSDQRRVCLLSGPCACRRLQRRDPLSGPPRSRRTPHQRAATPARLSKLLIIVLKNTGNKVTPGFFPPSVAALRPCAMGMAHTCAARATLNPPPRSSVPARRTRRPKGLGSSSAATQPIIPRCTPLPRPAPGAAVA